MKIYLAGKWSDKINMRKMMMELEEIGHTITHNWTNNETPTRSPQELAYFAKLDIDGVINADYVIAYMDDPKYAYRGTFTEIGCAIGCKKRIIIVSPDYDLTNKDEQPYYSTNCFFHHTQIEHVNSWKLCKSMLAI